MKEGKGEVEAEQRETTSGADELLKRFYAAASDAAADMLVDELVTCVTPRIREYLLGQRVRGDDLEDLCQKSRVHLLQALRASRESGGKPIENATAFTVTVARNLLRDAFRQERARPPTDSLDALAEGGNRNPDSLLPASKDDVAAIVLDALSTEHLRERLWREIGALPPLQRAALLLGMEADELFLLQIRQSEIAKAIGVSLAELLTFWGGLPLPDQQIARRLGVADGSKVSNLRKSARARLARRLADPQP